MENKQETIGSVILDLTYYSGEDLYSDGDVEEKLLEIARENREEDLNRVIAREESWPVLYHFSHIRENIINGIPFAGDEEVLEIGAGCGAVTGALAEKCGSLTCVDLSLRRSRINAWRHRDMDNVTIMVGNFQDIEKGLTKKFDVISLIGISFSVRLLTHAAGIVLRFGDREPAGNQYDVILLLNKFRDYGFIGVYLRGCIFFCVLYRDAADLYLSGILTYIGFLSIQSNAGQLIVAF